jgi:hypothetical protein
VTVSKSAFLAVKLLSLGLEPVESLKGRVKKQQSTIKHPTIKQINHGITICRSVENQDG